MEMNMKWGVVLVVSFSVLAWAPAGELSAKTPAEVTPEETVRLVGPLRETSTRKRLKDGTNEEVNHRIKLGHVNLIPTELDLKSMMEKLVVIEGVIDREYQWPPVAHERGPDIIQARSDWRVDEDGRLEIDRGGQPPFGTVRPSKISVVEGFSIEVDGTDLVIVFENSLGTVLEDAKFSLFYEGCYGKPGTMSRVDTVGKMEPGAKKTLRLPLVNITGEEPVSIKAHTRHSRRVHAADTFRIDAHAPGIYFDAEIPIPNVAFSNVDSGIRRVCRKEP